MVVSKKISQATFERIKDMSEYRPWEALVYDEEADVFTRVPTLFLPHLPEYYKVVFDPQAMTIADGITASQAREIFTHFAFVAMMNVVLGE